MWRITPDLYLAYGILTILNAWLGMREKLIAPEEADPNFIVGSIFAVMGLLLFYITHFVSTKGFGKTAKTLLQGLTQFYFLIVFLVIGVSMDGLFLYSFVFGGAAENRYGIKDQWIFGIMILIIFVPALLVINPFSDFVNKIEGILKRPFEPLTRRLKEFQKKIDERNHEESKKIPGWIWLVTFIFGFFITVAETFILGSAELQILKKLEALGIMVLSFLLALIVSLTIRKLSKDPESKRSVILRSESFLFFTFVCIVLIFYLCRGWGMF